MDSVPSMNLLETELSRWRLESKQVVHRWYYVVENEALQIPQTLAKTLE